MLKVSRSDTVGEVLSRVLEKLEKADSLKDKDSYHVFLPAGAAERYTASSLLSFFCM